MSATDESQSVDAGWDDEAASAPGEDDIDSAWDSLPPPASGAAVGAAPSRPQVTEEVDSGWDDLPEGGVAPASGKRRPHRPRRTKTSAPVQAANPVRLPRPAEPTKKHQREHARKQRAYEAQVKQQRKDEKKAQRAAQAREEAAARLRQTEAEEQARRLRREARERQASERPPAKPAAPKRAVHKSPAPALAVKVDAAVAPTRPHKSGLRPGIIVTLLVVAVLAALLVLRK